MSTSFRRRALGALVIVGLLAALGASAAAAGSPFTGLWRSTDIDGSSQQLMIGGGGATQHVVYLDHGASVCGWTPGAHGPAAIARGIGTEAGGILSASMPVICLTHPPSSIGSYDFEFSYDAATDTLSDGSGVTWSRP
ncbi:MAG: hypothetical protein WBR18_15525 [Anaerolineales bacterium]